MKKKKVLWIGGILLIVLIAIPFVEKYVLGMQLRLVPGAQMQVQGSAVQPEATPPETASLTESGSEDMAITTDYGYYPEDKWTEKQCGFYVTAPAAGEIVLKIYYPFEVTGTQEGHVYLDGQFSLDFVISGENQEVSIPCEEGQHYVQINSDFAREPGAEDKRALAFVLSGVMFQAKEQGGVK